MENKFLNYKSSIIIKHISSAKQIVYSLNAVILPLVGLLDGLDGVLCLKNIKNNMLRRFSMSLFMILG